MRSITVVGVANHAHRLRAQLERTIGGQHIQPLAQNRIGFQGAVGSPAELLSIFKDEFLLFLGNLFLSFSTLTEEFFSVPTQISLYCNLTVVFSLCSSKRSLVLSFLWTYLGS